MNLLVFDTATIHGLSDRALLFLLLALERVWEATAEAAVGFGVTSHLERAENEVKCCSRLVKCSVVNLEAS